MSRTATSGVATYFLSVFTLGRRGSVGIAGAVVRGRQSFGRAFADLALTTNVTLSVIVTIIAGGVHGVCNTSIPGAVVCNCAAGRNTSVGFAVNGVARMETICILSVISCVAITVRAIPPVSIVSLVTFITPLRLRRILTIPFRIAAIIAIIGDVVVVVLGRSVSDGTAWQQRQDFPESARKCVQNGYGILMRTQDVVHGMPW